jgi:hypothetical protein
MEARGFSLKYFGYGPNMDGFSRHGLATSRLPKMFEAQSQAGRASLAWLVSCSVGAFVPRLEARVLSLRIA